MRVTLAVTIALTGAAALLHVPKRPVVSSATHLDRTTFDDTPRASRSFTRGPLPTPTPQPRSRQRSTRSTRPTLNWRALAYCEATGNPRAVDPSGTYFGLYQFDLGTWRSVGGRGNPADASPAEQTFRAELLYAQRGVAPWPVCGRHLHD